MTTPGNCTPQNFRAVSWGAVCAILCFVAICSARASATFTTVFTFPGGANKPTTAVVVGADGNFYGTTGDGGAIGAGAIYRVTPAGVVTTIYSFTDQADGSLPRAPLLKGPDGNFYDLTVRGKTDPNSSYSGTIFRVTPSGTLTTLHTFNGLDGTGPNTELVLGKDGKFYGTVKTGSSNSGALAANGAVYSITPSGTFKIVYSFLLTDDGYNPTSPLIKGTDGNFYGTTSTGLSTAGTVFKLTMPGGTLSTLHKFNSATDGSAPGKLIQGADGNFYGTTESGGTNGRGTAFKVTPTGAFSVLHTFDNSGSGYPGGVALVQASDGNFYGTSATAANSYGLVFRLTPAGNYSILYEFKEAASNGVIHITDNGATPEAPLIVGPDGNLYGTTSAGAVGGDTAVFRGDGTLFKITLGGALTTVARFLDAPFGKDPQAPLILTPGGDLVSDTTAGGANGYGVIFRLSTAGAASIIYDFGAQISDLGPWSVVRAEDGSFFGTAPDRRDNILGDVFEVTSSGAASLVHDFQGGRPNGRLMIGQDGNLYGTTAGSAGQVYKVTPIGDFSTLYSFKNGADGANPQGGLISTPDGKLIGATVESSSNSGVIFSVDSTGAEATLYRFTRGDDGSFANTPLTIGSDGNFYGSTQDGGLSRNGSVFKLTPAGQFTTLYSFTGANDGSRPVADLIQASDGKFYGTTEFDGANNGLGTIFSITSSGSLITLHTFDSLAGGANPTMPLVQASDGSFYGTTSDDGPNFTGTVFRLVVSGVPPIVAPKLLNIATRLRVLTGENVLIGGFIITGTDPKKVIIRGIGPSLSGVGVTLANPTLELHQGATTLAVNDDWKEHQAEVEATTIPPTNDLESAIVTTLNPGAYTAILADKGGGSGVGVVEVYDLGQAANSKLANISTRGFVDTGNDVMIGGLIVGGGSSGATTRVIVRAIGPSLSNAGIQGALQDPTLELHDGSGTTIATNDNWKVSDTGGSQQGEVEATTVPPADDREAAIVHTLAAGNYTAIVRGKNNSTGVGVVEAYQLQ